MGENNYRPPQYGDQKDQNPQNNGPNDHSPQFGDP